MGVAVEGMDIWYMGLTRLSPIDFIKSRPIRVLWANLNSFPLIKYNSWDNLFLHSLDLTVEKMNQNNLHISKRSI